MPNDEGRIAAAVQAAEDRTCVEFHVWVEATAREPDTRAHALLRASTARGGRRQRMLIYFLAHDRRCYLATDPPLHPIATTRVWRDVENRLTLDILGGRVGEGLADAINRFSHIVAGHFPAVTSGMEQVPARSR
jgi:uncharacterized membrane protein